MSQVGSDSGGEVTQVGSDSSWECLRWGVTQVGSDSVESHMRRND